MVEEKAGEKSMELRLIVNRSTLKHNPKYTSTEKTNMKVTIFTTKVDK